MSLTIYSFKRAFTAKQRMALAAKDYTAPLRAIEAKDISDCLHLGLACGIIHFEEADQSNVDEFIAQCDTILEGLSRGVNNAKFNAQVTIPLSTNRCICLNEENQCIQLKMDGKQETLPDLTLQNLYDNLIGDIRNYPDLYGNRLTNYVNTHNKELFTV